jgi:hypothetical protein
MIEPFCRGGELPQSDLHAKDLSHDARSTLLHIRRSPIQTANSEGLGIGTGLVGHDAPQNQPSQEPIYRGGAVLGTKNISKRTQNSEDVKGNQIPTRMGQGRIKQISEGIAVQE